MPKIAHTLLAAVFALVANATAFAAQDHVITVEISSATAYQNIIASSIIDNLARAGINAVQSTATGNTSGHIHITVTLQGTGTDADAARQPQPILYIAPDLANKDTGISPSSAPVTMLSIDQPFCRQLRLIVKLNPHWNKVGLLLNHKAAISLDTLQQCGRQYKLELQIVYVDDYPGLIQATDIALSKSDVLLAIADGEIYNRRTIKNILLSAYRHRIPVIGYSDSFVKAGALAAVFTTPQQIGEQAAGIIRHHIAAKGNIVPGHYVPYPYLMSINHQVARALELDLPDQTDILNALLHGDGAQ